MLIRKAIISDINPLMDIYDHARQFMRSVGNANQWINGYPSEEIIRKDILNGNSYVCINNNVIVGVFCFFQGDDPTYTKIYDGEWLDDKPYGVIHRLASSGTVKGVADFCFQWCYQQCGNIRVDTHKDNTVLQHVLRKNGYKQCGIIYISNGTQRIAFQKN